MLIVVLILSVLLVCLAVIAAISVYVLLFQMPSARAVLEDLHDSGLRSFIEDVGLAQAEDGVVKVTVTMTFLEYGSPEEGTQTAE